MSTSNTSVATRPPPSRWWYAFALFLVLFGFVVMAAFMVPRIMAIPASLQQAVFPGAAEIVVASPGDFTIFHERESVVDGEVFSSGRVDGLRVKVFAPDGAAVPVSDVEVRSSYSVGGRAGEAILAFSAVSAGTYRLQADYKSGETEPRVVLAVGSGFLRDLLITLFGSLGIAFCGIGAGALVAVMTRRKRRAAQAST